MGAAIGRHCGGSTEGGDTAGAVQRCGHVDVATPRLCGEPAMTTTRSCLATGRWGPVQGQGPAGVGVGDKFTPISVFWAWARNKFGVGPRSFVPNQAMTRPVANLSGDDDDESRRQSVDSL
uniref:Uncharacterized protein n=1 Tax=Oryza brachyantha TaxID=4533 RepID=J3KU14_ORYBR